MARITVLSLLMFSFLLAISLHAQTFVTPSGFASNRADWQSMNMPLLSTPVLDIGTASQSPVGASNATIGNAVGASNATMSLGVTSSAIMSPSPIVYSVPVLTPMPMAQPAPEAPATTQGHVSLGAASFNTAYDFSDLGGRSLAEVARLSKQRAQQHPAKVYTNESIQQLKPPTNVQPLPANQEQPSNPT